MTAKEIERYGLELAERLRQIEREGRSSTDEIQKQKLREQYAGVRMALVGLRWACRAAVEMAR